MPVCQIKSSTTAEMESDRTVKFSSTGARVGLTSLKQSAKNVVKRVVPSQVRQWLRTHQRSLSFWPPIGWVRFVSLRRVVPVSQIFGLERGHGIDRYYIERFLARHAEDVRGAVLEIPRSTGESEGNHSGGFNFRQEYFVG
jgi:hypothetical protein